jgi:ketosteroid isomerase-like protein
VIESWRQWLENFDEWGYEVEEVRDCGDRVLATIREEARGSASGATVSARNYIVMTFRDGKILRYQEFYDQGMALEAAGLREEGL